MTDVRRKLATGASWMVAVRIVDRTLGLVSTIILARLLVPKDFGLVAMATSVLALLELTSNFGFDIALIRQSGTDRTQYDTAWTFNALLGLGITIALIALAYPAARFYGEPRVVGVIFALAAAPLIQGFENIGVVMFRKELNFRAEFMWLTGKRLAGLAVVLPLAFVLRSYWALVIGIMAGRLAGVLLSYGAHPYRPRISIASRRDLLGFSKWILLLSMLQFLLQRCADLIVGRTLGAGPLGIYNVALEVASLPTTELVAPINRAVYPAFAKIAGDRAQLKHEYLAVIGIIALFALPAASGLAAVAAQVVPLLLGEKWVEAVPLIKVLAVLGAVQFAYTNAYSVFLAVGRPGFQVTLNAINVPLIVGLMIYLTAQQGIIGAAWAAAVAGTLMVPFSLAFIFRELDLSISEFARVVWRPGLSAGIMYICVVGLAARMHATLGFASELFHLLLLVCFGAAVYTLIVTLLWRTAGSPKSAERIVLTRVLNLFKRA